MVKENRLHPSDFIVPFFIIEGENKKEEISSMPGYYRYSIDLLIEEAKECFNLGIKSALLFVKVEDELKDNSGKEALNPNGLMQRSIKALKENVPQLYLMSDVALGIMSYSVKYASSFYGPFRDALDSAPGFGDKKTYQMDPSNSSEGISEVEQDIEEGADVVMIKPGMPYLDMVKQIKNNFDTIISVYQVSGEYAMIKAASDKGWLNQQDVMMESLIAFKRAGANLIATYFAKEAAKILKDE